MATTKNNTGDYNTGDYNTGDYNTGDYNTGSRNTGDRNTGYYNTGDCNTGDCNTGDYNTGDGNTGDYNTGDCNTGDCNTGDYNTGDGNTGDYNTGDYNTGDCNETTPTVKLFDKDSGWEFLGPEHSNFRRILYELTLPLCEWVSEANMSDEEKIKFSTYKTTGGYLKVNKNISSSKEASKEDREFLLSVPNFNAGILKRTTGIDIDNEKVKIIIDGREIWISKESAENMKKALMG